MINFTLNSLGKPSVHPHMCFSLSFIKPSFINQFFNIFDPKLLRETCRNWDTILAGIHIKALPYFFFLPPCINFHKAGMLSYVIYCGNVGSWVVFYQFPSVACFPYCYKIAYLTDLHIVLSPHTSPVHMIWLVTFRCVPKGT